jgi:hypothetical protein
MEKKPNVARKSWLNIWSYFARLPLKQRRISPATHPLDVSSYGRGGGIVYWIDYGIFFFLSKVGSRSRLILLAYPLKAGRKSSATVPLASSYGRGVVYPPGQITGSFVNSWLKIPPFSARLPYHKNKKEISNYCSFK